MRYYQIEVTNDSWTVCPVTGANGINCTLCPNIDNGYILKGIIYFTTKVWWLFGKKVRIIAYKVYRYIPRESSTIALEKSILESQLRSLVINFGKISWDIKSVENKYDENNNLIGTDYEFEIFKIKVNHLFGKIKLNKLETKIIRGDRKNIDKVVELINQYVKDNYN